MEIKQRLKSEPSPYLFVKDKQFFLPSNPNKKLEDFKRKVLKDYTKEKQSMHPRITHQLYPIQKLSEGSLKTHMIAKTERKNKQQAKKLENRFFENQIYIKGSYNLSLQQKISQLALIPKVPYHVNHTKTRPLKKQTGLKLPKLQSSQRINSIVSLSKGSKEKILTLSLTKDNPQFINWRYRPYFQKSEELKQPSSERKIGHFETNQSKVTLLDYLRMKSYKKFEQHTDNLSLIQLKLKEAQLKKKKLNTEE